MRGLGLIILAACDGGGGGVRPDGGSDPGPIGSESCALSITLTGAIAFTNTEAPACGIPFGPETGVLMVFVPVEDAAAFGTIEIDVDDIAKEMTGTFPASAAINNDDQTRFVGGDCSVTVTRNQYQRDVELGNAEYFLAGTGTCGAALTKVDSTDTVTVAPFAFRFPAIWPKQ